MAFRIFSNAFSEGGLIPQLNSCDGADVSPSLEWSTTGDREPSGVSIS